MLNKVKKLLSTDTLRSIYYAICDSHLNQDYLVWGQNTNAIKRLIILQKKTLRLMDFKPRNVHTSLLHLRLNILKLPEKMFQKIVYQGHVWDMHQPYNRIRLSLSATNCMKIRNLIHNRTITKCFSFYKKHIFDSTNMFCVTILFSIP